jgi:alpha-methylacyl-CoA racemase
MVLADLGADVVTIERPGGPILGDRGVTDEGIDIVGRGARKVVLDLKSLQGGADARTLASRADVVIEGFRPGVTERLGLGPEALMALNPRLVYARVTGYGQDGPLADRAGHDINYIAQTGLLSSIGRAGGPPQVPINIVGDYGSGGMLTTMGICAALFERERSGTGQVIDSAMVDGVALLMAPLWEKRASGHWSGARHESARYRCRHLRRLRNRRWCVDGDRLSRATVQSATCRGTRS